MVSSGISSMKHFFSVSPMWKYKEETKLVKRLKIKTENKLDFIFNNRQQRERHTEHALRLQCHVNYGTILANQREGRGTWVL